MTAQQPDVAGAVLALDQAMIALAVAKSTLLGETSSPMTVPLAAPVARGRYDAASAAEVAEGVEPFPHVPHLPQHTHGNPVCDLCGIDHDAQVRIPPPGWIGYIRPLPGYLAPPAGYQLRQGTIPATDA